MTRKLNSILGTSEVLWTLDDLYSGIDDVTIKKDSDWLRKESSAVEEYAGKLASLSPTEMQSLVSRLEAISVKLGKLSTYAFLNFTTQIQNAKAGAFLQQVKELGSEIGRQIVFFELEWNMLPQQTAERYLKAPELAGYRHHLENLRRYAPHQLSQVEEKLLIDIAPAGRSSWTNLFEKIIGHIKFGARQRTEEEVLADLYSDKREIRCQAADDLTAGLNSQIHILTHVFNTLLADKMIDDRLRSYSSWVSSMNLYNEVEDRTVEALISAVTSRYDIVQRYYHLKRQMLGLSELADYDRYAPLPHLPQQTVPWAEARHLVLEAMDHFSPKMASIAEKFFDRRWIHAPILEGKRGGAFAHPCVPEIHPYVLVNYTGNIRDISTVAHELGHGVHQYLAAGQGYFNSATPLVLAETASVFAELLLFKFQLKSIANEEERKAFTCQKLESIFATVFRQIAMNRFENAVHLARREKGELAAEDISAQWRATQSVMFADSVVLRSEYDIWWSYIPHFVSSPGYVYSYAFGELLVLSLYAIYQERGDSFVPMYLDLLAAGGSRSPSTLLAPFGINLDDPAFWGQGLDFIDSMLREIES
ncbi:MAG: M3 family oligoendopeptidase [Deltaproteobacteria bacterium]